MEFENLKQMWPKIDFRSPFNIKITSKGEIYFTITGLHNVITGKQSSSYICLFSFWKFEQSIFKFPDFWIIFNFPDHFTEFPDLEEKTNFPDFSLTSGHPAFKDISYGSRTICAILVEYIMRNNSVKSFWIWTSGSGGNAIQRYFLSGAMAALLFSRVEPNHTCNFSRGMRNNWIILWNYFEFESVVQEKISALAALLFGWVEPFMLKEGIMGNIHVSYEIWTSGSRDCV